MNNFEYILFKILSVAFDILIGIWILGSLLLYVAKNLSVQYKKTENEIETKVHSKKKDDLEEKL